MTSPSWPRSSMFCRTGAASTTRSASEITYSSSAATSMACRTIACSRTSFRSTAMTRLAGQVSLAAIEIDPPMRPRPTMAIFSKIGGWPCGREGTIGSRRSCSGMLNERACSAGCRLPAAYCLLPCPAAARDRLQADTPADRGRDDPQLRHQPIELRREHRLRAVAQRVVGIVVHLDDETVGASGDRGPGHGCHLVAPSRAVAGIGDDRKM